MKTSLAQQADIVCVKYFIPTNVAWSPITSKDEEMFLEYSERGLHKEKIHNVYHTQENRDGFNALVWGKIWRGRHMEMWEEGVMDGTQPYLTLLGAFENKKKWWQFWKSEHEPIPREVVDFMKKEMFKGIDSDTIEVCYQKLRCE